MRRRHLSQENKGPPRVFLTPSGGGLGALKKPSYPPPVGADGRLKRVSMLLISLVFPLSRERRIRVFEVPISGKNRRHTVHKIGTQKKVQAKK